MGLIMYLYRANKKVVEELNRLKKVERDLYKMWEPIVEHEFPKYWYGYGKSKMTEQQRKLVDERNDEFYVISQKRQAIYNEMNAIKDSSEKHTDSLLWSWKKFNTLHKYIIDNFSDGIYEGQIIPLTKDDVVQILNFLNKIHVMPSTSKNRGSYIDDSYAINTTKAIGIFSMIARKWDDDFGVWYRAHW